MNRTLYLTAPMFGILLCIGCGIGWLLWKKRNFKTRYWVIAAFVCYVLMVIELTLFPIHIYNAETLEAIRKGSGKYFVFYQIVPFASIKNYFQAATWIQLVGNMVLLAPLAVFLEVFLRQRVKAWKVVVMAASASFLIEILQLAENYITGYPERVADVDDLLLNIAGVALTILLTRFIGKKQNIRQKLRKILYR